jgi:tyrosyl-tRNA synthetase
MQFQRFPEGAQIKPGSRVKFGIDPTFNKLHLGHYVPLRLVKWFQKMGHPVTIVLGTFTAQLGDPSGRDKTRPMIPHDDCLKNADHIHHQLEKLLHPGWKLFNNATLHYNTSVAKFLKTVANFTLTHMTSRDSFQKRIEAGESIGMHELMVPICQGMDSVHLETEVEIGGQDQLFNFQITRRLQEIDGQPPQVCLMLPIIRGTDGRKMSKSYQNCIWLDEPAKHIFGKVMSIPDDVMEEWIPLFMEKDIDIKSYTNPMDRKKLLAFSIVAELYDWQTAVQETEAFQKTVQNKEPPAEIPEIAGLTLIEVLTKLRKCSRSAARRLVEQGAVYLGDQKVTNETVALHDNDIVKVGLDYGRVKLPNFQMP